MYCIKVCCFHLAARLLSYIILATFLEIAYLVGGGTFAVVDVGNFSKKYFYL